MLPEITVLMPNYNNSAFLKEAIDSILNQTFKNFIFLIVDDGSTDNSVQIIKNYSDTRIVLIQKEKNSGIVDTLNIGLERINSKFIIRMDGDDISAPDRLEILYDFMEKNPKIGVCGSQMSFMGKDNSTTNYSINSDLIKSRLIFNAGVSHPATIFRTSILKENNLLYRNNHPFMEDYDLFLRLKKHTEFANINKVLYHYRLLDHNSTVKNRETLLTRYRNIYKEVLSELNIENVDKNVELHLEFFIKNSISYKVREYKIWLDFLISQNEKLKIYPQQAFKEILTERWNLFFFKVAPLSIFKNMEYFFVSKKISLPKINYLLKFKVNKLIGRKQ